MPFGLGGRRVIPPPRMGGGFERRVPGGGFTGGRIPTLPSSGGFTGLSPSTLPTRRLPAAGDLMSTGRAPIDMTPKAPGVDWGGMATGVIGALQNMRGQRQPQAPQAAPMEGLQLRKKFTDLSPEASMGWGSMGGY